MREQSGILNRTVDSLDVWTSATLRTSQTYYRFCRYLDHCGAGQNTTQASYPYFVQRSRTFVSTACQASMRGGHCSAAIKHVKLHYWSERQFLPCMFEYHPRPRRTGDAVPDILMGFTSLRSLQLRNVALGHMYNPMSALPNSGEEA